jgi:putative ABC transport system permease protein
MKRSLRSWLWRVPLDQEFEEEIAMHLEMRTRELIDAGMDPADARAAAIRKMGDVRSLKRECVDLGRKRDREMHVTLFLEELRDDIKFAFRQLIAAPAFTLVATLTLALGIGANSAIFALVDATLLRPLPYPNPDRLVTIWEKSPATARGFASPLNMLDWNSRSRSFEKIAGFSPGVGSMVLAKPDGTAETVSRQWVTAGIFDVLGVPPIAGRTFSADDEQKRARVVVFSEGLWETRFNRSADILGKDVKLDGELWTVIGVVPKQFEILGKTSMWAMRPYVNLPPRARAAYQLQVVGRLRPGVSVATAQADLTNVADGLSREFPQFNKDRSVAIEPMHDTMVGSDLKTTSMLFLGVVGFVLLICCANVANLLLARATARTRELAVRSALGAGRVRIIRQLLTESVVLALVGGVLGIGVGYAILSVAPVLIPEGLLPGTVTLQFDMRVVAFCAIAALLVGVLFGIAPAWQATSFSSPEVMGSDTRTVTGGRGVKIRNLLVVGEIATAVLLLCGAGLLLRTLLAVNAFDRGFKAQSVLTMLVDPLGPTYPTPETLLQFYDNVEAEVRALPGVQDVGWSSGVPMGESIFGEYPQTYEIVGDAPVEESRKPTTNYQIVSASYFSTLDLAIVAGRNFDARDTRGKPPVAIVNEAFARAIGRDPIGLQVAFRPADTQTQDPAIVQIVGVAKQVKQRPDEKTDFVQLYTPLAQNPLGDIMLMVRSQNERAAALAPPVRAAIERIDRSQTTGVASVTTLEDVEWAATGRHRFRAVMVSAFATLAVVLAMVGVFGILAYSVQQRMRDFGVRRAFGATTRDVTSLVIRSAASLIGVGAVVGLVLAAMFSRVIGSMLFGVQPLDSATFGLVAVVLTITGALAIAGPAWRAARIEPAAVLRSK